MSDTYIKLDPPARFGSNVLEGEFDYVTVRLFVGDEAVAAVLDGLHIQTIADLRRVLDVGVAVITHTMSANADDDDEGSWRSRIPAELEMLGERLPLAAKAMRNLDINMETRGPGFDIAAREERDAQMEAILTGIPDAFKVTKGEKLQLLDTIPDLQAEMEDDLAKEELGLILADLAHGRMLQSLPIPKLVYWCRPIMDQIHGRGWSKVHGAETKAEEATVRDEHEVIRGMWNRLSREVREHGRG